MVVKSIGLAALFGAAMLAAGAANATAVTYSDKTAWTTAAGGPITSTTTDGRTVDTFQSTITLGDGTLLDAGSDLFTIRKVPESWATWSGDYKGIVYDANVGSSLTFTLSGLSAFGLEMEPNSTSGALFDITLELDDGSTLTQGVSGDGGALFFGWVGEGITSFTISSSDEFAFGNIVSARAQSTPEPLTLALFGAGLAGIGAIRRRKALA
jgi:hypothetical protein